MYSIEYKCTNVEIVQTTTNITTVNESNKNPNDTLNNSEFTHEYDIIDTVSPCIPTLKKVMKTSNKVIHIQKVDKIPEPLGPKNLPPKPLNKEPSNGNNTIKIGIV
jgi:hypothetical protein